MFNTVFARRKFPNRTAFSWEILSLHLSDLYIYIFISASKLLEIANCSQLCICDVYPGTGIRSKTNNFWTAAVGWS